jgi:hypothetical protein
MTLVDVFPEADYRFHLRFERVTFSDFFRATSRGCQLLAERRHWLKTASETYSGLLPEGIPLLRETISLGRAEKVLPDQFSSGHSPTPSLLNSSTPQLLHSLLALGEVWEPDFLLLKPGSAGQMLLVGGCVCFPSSWSLAEKMGRPMDAIHGVVPGLNSAIGNQIDGFLKKLRPGVAWQRANWGLSRSPELNQHPERKLPRLDSGVLLNEVWLRIEYQTLTALPENQGVLFAIRIATHPLAEIHSDPLIAPRLVRALETMPGAMAEYKGIATARPKIISLLRG